MTGIPETHDCTMECTGDVCAGDVILWTEAVWGGSRRRPEKLGERRVVGRVVRDSYGETKQQHTLTIDIIASDGYEPLAAGQRKHRKARNVYRNGTFRQPWADESARRLALSDKHERGDAARAERDARRNGMPDDIVW